MEATTFFAADTEHSSNGSEPHDNPAGDAGRQVPDAVLVVAAVVGLAVAGISISALSSRMASLVTAAHPED